MNLVIYSSPKEWAADASLCATEIVDVRYTVVRTLDPNSSQFAAAEASYSVGWGTYEALHRLTVPLGAVIGDRLDEAQARHAEIVLGAAQEVAGRCNLPLLNGAVRMPEEMRPKGDGR